jgi:hypothetical protein
MYHMYIDSVSARQVNDSPGQMMLQQWKPPKQENPGISARAFRGLRHVEPIQPAKPMLQRPREILYASSSPLGRVELVK